jgi:hypothetical protein
VVILPVRGPESLVGSWGEDLAVALEAQFNSTRFLVARSVRGDTVAAEAAAATRSRWSLQPEAFSDGTLRVTLWDHQEQLGEKEDFGIPAGGLAFARAVEVATVLLPRLMPTGGQIDQTVFGQSNVEALAAFLQGERAYRAGGFAAADSLFGEAIRLDSGFTWAALRGAQAASWKAEHGRALALVQVALRTTDSLGPRYAAFARGLEDYQLGEADSAIAHLREAVRLDSLWAEAHMAMAEVYQHYLPAEGAAFDSARAHFELAREYDPTFTPPLWHLLQLAVMRQDRPAADSLVELYKRSDADESERIQAGLMVACLRSELSAEQWQRAVDDSVDPPGQAAVWLAVGGMRNAGCAEDGLRAIPLDPAVARHFATYAPVVLAHILAARGDSAGLRELLTSPKGMTTYFRAYLTIAIAAAGRPIGRDLVAAAEATTRARVESLADTLPRNRLQNRWLLGIRAVARGDTVEAASWIVAMLALPADSAMTPLRERLATSLSARLALAQGDTTRALSLLERLAPGVPQRDLRWNPLLAFAHERMLRVRIYEARGETKRAEELAASFDSPASYGLLLYLPESLHRRGTLAERLGKVEHREPSGARLEQLRPSARARGL